MPSVSRPYVEQLLEVEALGCDGGEHLAVLVVEGQRRRLVDAQRLVDVVGFDGVDQHRPVARLKQVRLLVADPFLGERLAHLVGAVGELLHPVAKQIDLVGVDAERAHVEHALDAMRPARVREPRAVRPAQRSTRRTSGSTRPAPASRSSAAAAVSVQPERATSSMSNTGPGGTSPATRRPASAADA